MKKSVLFFSILASLALTACGGNTPVSSEEPQPSSEEPAPISSEEPEPEPEEERPIVFVLSGQSNMEGQSKTANLEAAFTNQNLDDYNDIKDGMPEVLTTFSGCGYGQLSVDGNGSLHASNKENPKVPLFMPTKPGMGSSDSSMGPELGCAYKLRSEGVATEERPIYFIKAAYSGSGFDQSGTKWNWKVTEEKEDLYNTFALPYIKAALELIEEETGVKPELRGWMWHQGESDGGEERKVNSYKDWMQELLGQFREDLAEYAPDEDGANIAFIDAMIYDGSGSQWKLAKELNAVKQEMADEDDMYWLINTSCTVDGGMALKTGNPGGDSMHYCTEDSLRLGMAYADVIIDNGLAE